MKIEISQLPENFKKLIELYVTVGSTQYQAELIQDNELWRRINSTTQSSTSDYVQFCYIKADRIELFPIPSSAQTATLSTACRRAGGSTGAMVSSY